jgi:DNA-binding IclR family transcriptional regulator
MSKIVDRTLDLLELFGKEKRPLTLSDIAHLLKIPMSSCHDVVHAMQARGYLYELAPRAGYYPTSRLHDLGKEIGDNDPIVKRAQVLLGPLRDTVDETVLLAKVTGLNATYLLVLEPMHPLYVRVKVGDGIRCLHGTSAGKALLGSLEDPALAAFLRSAKLQSFTKNTITSKKMLRDDIELGRKRQWYLNREETLSGVITVSAIFRSYSSTYIVTIAGISSRMEQKLENAIRLLANVCQLLETRSERV